MDKYVSLTGDFLLERKRLSEGLKRLETILVSPMVSNLLGQEVVIDIQAEIDRLSGSIFRLDSLAKGLTNRMQVDKFISAKNYLQELQAVAVACGEKYGKSLRVSTSEGDVKIDNSRLNTALPAIKEMLETFIEFCIESPRERILRGKREKSIFQISLKRLDESLQISIIADGNGVTPPLRDEHGSKLARAGVFAEFFGKSSKWSNWIITIPHYGPIVNCCKFTIDGIEVFIPNTSVRTIDTAASNHAEGIHEYVWINSKMEHSIISQHSEFIKDKYLLRISAGTKTVYLLIDAAPVHEDVFVKPVTENLTGYGRYLGIAVETRPVGQTLKPVINPTFVCYGGAL